ncbi:hypothetical protein [Allohahella marinimesophila]|uniref:Uncharacterized protein n=1 Tax=Allohahella marinimesophila TaxID=1054972 RepID=A0ABP7NV07_9GAMM
MSKKKKNGRPVVAPELKRSLDVRMYVSQEEMEQLLRDSKSAGFIMLSKYFRDVMLTKSRKSKAPEKADLIEQLTKTTRLAIAASKKSDAADEVKQITAELLKANKALAKFIRSAQ